MTIHGVRRVISSLVFELLKCNFYLGWELILGQRNIYANHLFERNLY